MKERSREKSLLLLYLYQSDAITGLSNNFKTKTVSVGTIVGSETIYGMSTYNNIRGVPSIKVDDSGSHTRYYYDIIIDYSYYGGGSVSANYASDYDMPKIYKVNVIYVD